ncbi:MAG: FABP family protein [Acidimicrobiia bacterium]|nr:FABP family protein [Acidimicrobiia bacterium]MDH3396963.1 FABP family protein [Acidimicrobiia bacterium]
MDAAHHPAVEPLAFLLGRWRGEGKGEYPTIEPFVYGEEIEFSHNGRPFLFYVQKTWNPVDGYPMHSETGYLRPVAEGRVELVLAQPSGITEILAGTVSGSRIELTSTLVGVSPTAKQVSAVKRMISVTGTTLSYQLDMAAVGQDLSIHLHADLEKVLGP